MKEENIAKRLTIPKNTKERGSVIKKYKNTKPSRKYHTAENTDWLRKRISSSCTIRSIFTLLPNNGEPDLKYEDYTPNMVLRYFLKTHCVMPDRFENHNINPKYLFTYELYNRIRKLKDIFIDFDQKGTRRMDIEALCKMFHENKIPCTTQDIFNLFFCYEIKKKMPKKKCPAIDFYDFMCFALSKEADQYFRNFMRKIKIKVKKEKEKNVAIANVDGNDFTLNSSVSTDYLPMSFNNLLDYFTEKERDRECREAIRKSIKLIDEFLEEIEKCKKEKLNQASEKNLGSRSARSSSNSSLCTQRSHGVFNVENNVATKAVNIKKKSLFIKSNLKLSDKENIPVIAKTGELFEELKLVNKAKDFYNNNSRTSKGSEIKIQLGHEDINTNGILNKFQTLIVGNVTDTHKTANKRRTTRLPSNNMKSKFVTSESKAVAYKNFNKRPNSVSLLDPNSLCLFEEKDDNYLTKIVKDNIENIDQRLENESNLFQYKSIAMVREMYLKKQEIFSPQSSTPSFNISLSATNLRLNSGRSCHTKGQSTRVISAYTRNNGTLNVDATMNNLQNNENYVTKDFSNKTLIVNPRIIRSPTHHKRFPKVPILKESQKYFFKTKAEKEKLENDHLPFNLTFVRKVIS